MSRVFAVVAVLLVLFVAAQAVPHAVEQETPDSHANNQTAEDAGRVALNLTTQVGGVAALAIGVFALLGFIIALGA
jgi:hypothetical protein